MATFQIHEDIENYPDGFKAKKFCDGVQKNVAKKSFGENRCVLQAVNNSIKQDAKRPKLTKDDFENTVKVEQKVEFELKQQKVEDEFLKIEKEDIKVKEFEKDYFPPSLLHEVEYRKDIYNYLRDLEENCSRPKRNYMLKQVDLSWNTRSILVDWLASVAEEYRLCDQTFHLSVNYIDRFLSQISVVRSKFQLVGAVAMMLAGKIEEIYPIEANEWAYLTGDAFSVRQVLKMEQLIIKVLRFRMQPPTIYTFIQQYCTDHNIDAKTMHLALYLSELVLLEGDDYLNHVPSKLAAASIVLARHTLKEKPWPKKLRETSGYTLKQLSPVVQRQQKTFRDSPLKEQQTIQNKYKSEKYNKVALLRPRALLLDQLEDEE